MAVTGAVLVGRGRGRRAVAGRGVGVLRGQSRVPAAAVDLARGRHVLRAAEVVRRPHTVVHVEHQVAGALRGDVHGVEVAGGLVLVVGAAGASVLPRRAAAHLGLVLVALLLGGLRARDVHPQLGAGVDSVGVVAELVLRGSHRDRSHVLGHGLAGHPHVVHADQTQEEGRDVGGHLDPEAVGVRLLGDRDRGVPRPADRVAVLGHGAGRDRRRLGQVRRQEDHPGVRTRVRGALDPLRLEVPVGHVDGEAGEEDHGEQRQGEPHHGDAALTTVPLPPRRDPAADRTRALVPPRQHWSPGSGSRRITVRPSTKLYWPISLVR